MDDNRRYEAFVRNRITELREQKGISEHRMSLELGAWKERLLHQKHHQWNFYALSPGAVQHHGIL